MARVVRDADLAGAIDLRAVVDRMAAGYRADAEGGVVTFPRSRSDARGVVLAFLGAAIPREGCLGFRAYLYRGTGEDRGEQVVALYDFSSMELRGVLLGSLVGVLRTGASAAAALLLAEPELGEIGLLGTGTQARSTLACLTAKRRPDRVLAFGPHRGRAETFRRWASRSLGVEVELAPSAASVVAGAPAVACLTSSDEPVVTAEMLGAPRLLLSISAYRRPEIDRKVFEAAPYVFTDSVLQAGGPGTLFDDSARRAKLRPLVAGLSDGSLKDRRVTRIVLNTGAPWEEVLLADLLLRVASAQGLGREMPLATQTARRPALEAYLTVPRAGIDSSVRGAGRRRSRRG